jgi:hypothetical protein
VLVTDAEKGLSGFAQVAPAHSTVDVPLMPMAVYSGTLVDKEGKPLAGRRLRLNVAGTEFTADEDQRTDDEGAFRFDHVASNVPLDLQIRDRLGGQIGDRRPEKRLFLPGETRQNQRVVFTAIVPASARSKAAARPRRALAERVADVTRDARLNALRAMVVMEGDASKNVTSAAEKALDLEEVPDVTAFLPLVLPVEDVKSESEAISKYRWPIPGAGELSLVVIDDDGKPVDSLRVNAGNVETAARQCAEFIMRSAPPPRDAKALLAAAREEAQRSGRRVWIVCGGPRCAPCFLLARWMEDQ